MDFQQRLSNIADTSKELKATQLCYLADLKAEERQMLKELWPTIATERRRRIMCELVDVSEDNVEFDFSSVFINALEDPDEQVRAGAIEGLWENEGRVVLRRLYDIMLRDPSDCVRVAATAAMSRFAYKAELGKLDEGWKEKIKSALTSVFRNDAEVMDVRRRAIEALAYFSDGSIRGLIREALASTDESMKASAIFSMGHTLDDLWLDIIIAAMDDPAARLRYEAARAAGEIGDRRAVEKLAKLVNDKDIEVRLAAITALGQIGGRRAADILTQGIRSTDDATCDAAKDALEALRFNADPLSSNP